MKSVVSFDRDLHDVLLERQQTCPNYAPTYLTKNGLRPGRILKLDESCISNPKSENSNWTGVAVSIKTARLIQSNLRFRISDLRCRTRPISKFPERSAFLVKYVGALLQGGESPPIQKFSQMSKLQTTGFDRGYTLSPLRGCILPRTGLGASAIDRVCHAGNPARF